MVEVPSISCLDFSVYLINNIQMQVQSKLWWNKSLDIKSSSFHHFHSENFGNAENQTQSSWLRSINATSCMLCRPPLQVGATIQEVITLRCNNAIDLFTVGKRIVVMKWRHAEAWISLTTDTADGFELEAEFHIHDSPSVLAIIKGPTLPHAG